MNEILQKELIYNTNWDVLVVLDACRYDKFENIYKGVLGDVGKLQKVISPATHTIEWLNKIFNDKYLDDVVYVSSNAFVNSKGFSPIHCGFTFDGRKHFFKIIDAWDEWDDELGNLHPRETNKFAIVGMDINPKKRFIIHYMQPHYPFISLGGEKGEAHKAILDGAGEGKGRSWRSKITKFTHRFLPHEIIWGTGKMFGVEPKWSLTRTWYKHGKTGIIEGYDKDLRLVLKHVKILIERYPNRKFIITSDHGERLGEKGNYGHGGQRNKELIEVPWLEIEKRI